MFEITIPTPPSVWDKDEGDLLTSSDPIERLAGKLYSHQDREVVLAVESRAEVNDYVCSQVNENMRGMVMNEITVFQVRKMAIDGLRYYLPSLELDIQVRKEGSSIFIEVLITDERVIHYEAVHYHRNVDERSDR